MKGIVADASVVVKYLFEEAGSDAAVRLLGDSEDVVAPELVFAECGNAVWKRARRGGLTQDAALDVLSLLDALSLQPLPLADLTADALGIALRFDHSIYDCYYLAAAIQTGHTLVTADRVLAGIAREVGLGEQVLLIGEQNAT
jgi:predicted nucleic acid-binding protein